MMTATNRPIQSIPTQELSRDLEDLEIEIKMHDCAMLLEMGDMDKHEQIVISGRKRVKEISNEIERRKQRNKFFTPAER